MIRGTATKSDGLWSVWSDSPCGVSKSTWIFQKTQSAESTNFQLSKTSKIFEIDRMVEENGQSEDRYQDSVGCLKIHVDLFKVRKSKNTNFQLPRTPKIIENDPMSTENGPKEVDLRSDLRSHLFFL